MPTDLAVLYRGAHARVVELVADLNPDELDRPVPCCPAWTVHGVVSHLAGVAEDAVAGLITGPPDDDVTAAEVARFRDTPLPAVLERWDQAAPSFEEMIGAFSVWPAVIDTVTHEQDIRGALRRPGGRDTDLVRVASSALFRNFEPPEPILLHIDDEDFACPGTAGPTAPLELRTTRWEALRWRMGRRSRLQLEGMDWSGDPTPVINHLVVFGPAETDILE